MRLPLIVLLAVAIAAPVAAQSRGQATAYDNPTARLTCKPAPAFKQAVDAIAASEVIQAADPEDRDFCLFIGGAGEGPWRRYAVVQMEDDPYWCGSAGCQVLFFVEDHDGRWKHVTDPDSTNNGFALEEGVGIDAADAEQGLPSIILPQRRGTNVDWYGWRFDAEKGVYRDLLPGTSD